MQLNVLVKSETDLEQRLIMSGTDGAKVNGWRCYLLLSVILSLFPFCKMTVPDEELLFFLLFFLTPPPSADFTAGFMTGHRGCSPTVDHLAK